MIDGPKSGEYRTVIGIPLDHPSPAYSVYLFYNAHLIKTCNTEHNTIAPGYINEAAILRWEVATEEICDSLSTTPGLAR